MATPASSAAAAPVLALYRALLRVHRTKLPTPVRELGNRYLRDEFQRHLRGTTTQQQWRTFLDEWERYRGMLAGAADLSLSDGVTFADADRIVSGIDRSGELQEGALSAMTPEQRARMERLRAEAAQFGREVLTSTTAAKDGK